MKVEKYIDNRRYILSNEVHFNLGDEVFHILEGRFDNYDIIVHKINIPENFLNPDIVTENDITSVYLHTNRGYSHRKRYFKIIKIEERIINNSSKFTAYIWKEIPLKNE